MAIIILAQAHTACPFMLKTYAEQLQLQLPEKVTKATTVSKFINTLPRNDNRI